MSRSGRSAHAPSRSSSRLPFFMSSEGARTAHLCSFCPLAKRAAPKHVAVAAGTPARAGGGARGRNALLNERALPAAAPGGFIIRIIIRIISRAGIRSYHQRQPEGHILLHAG